MLSAEFTLPIDSTDRREPMQSTESVDHRDHREIARRGHGGILTRSGAQRAVTSTECQPLAPSGKGST
jgi:hypothetical protein